MVIRSTMRSARASGHSESPWRLRRLYRAERLDFIRSNASFGMIEPTWARMKQGVSSISCKSDGIEAQTSCARLGLQDVDGNDMSPPT
jgi:hypothetical protein